MRVEHEAGLEGREGVVDHARGELVLAAEGDEVLRRDGHDDVDHAEELARQMAVGDQRDAHLAVTGSRREHRRREALGAGGVEERLLDVAVRLVAHGVLAAVQEVHDALLRKGVLRPPLVGQGAQRGDEPTGKRRGKGYGLWYSRRYSWKG